MNKYTIIKLIADYFKTQMNEMSVRALTMEELEDVNGAHRGCLKTRYTPGL